MEDKFKGAVLYITKSKIRNLHDFESAKRLVSKKYGITTPSNINLLKAYHSLLKNKRIRSDRNLEYLLRKRKVRSLSGIVNVSVLTKPYQCPGKCIFCPSQKGVPKSYLKKEPAVQRALLTNFDPFLQFKARLEGLEMAGHPIDKIELRIIGGTWSFYPDGYQRWFIFNCFRACNEYKTFQNSNSQFLISKKFPISKIQNSKLLEKEQRKNEKAKHRIIGLTIETRPDYVNFKEIVRFRELGITRVELGVQSIYDNVLNMSRRGHGVEEIVQATRLLKDAGFKVSYQMMPNLLGSSFKKDVGMFKELFSNPDFQPDLLKIYPLGLVKESVLYSWYKKKKFKPYSAATLIKLLTEIKNQIPYYVRIERIIRDIPAENIVSGGVKISNLREIVQGRVKCKCIRCREVKESYDRKEELYLLRQDYEASGGKEIFLSFENKDRTKLYALLRLRISTGYVLPVLKGCAVVREIHTYGQMIKISGNRERVLAVQHKGLGKKLMKEAERIAKKEFRLDKVAVIAGIGVRPYYRRLGYKLKNTYMVKKI